MNTPARWTRETHERFTLHIAPAPDVRLAFAMAVAQGLSSQVRSLPAAFLYDHDGSEIYERITEQPEYYLTRAEDALLARHAADIVARSGATTLIELGSGSSTKTRRLLDTGLQHYVAIDISESALRLAGKDLTARYPALQVEAFATTYELGLPHVADVDAALLSFMGSSIGNLSPAETDAFLERVAASLRPGSCFLLGVDKVKPISRLEAAYNDAAGWSAKFTKNLFTRMNAELGTNISADAVQHVAYYNDRLERIEIYAQFSQATELELLGQRFRLAPGEMVRTELSRKYRPADVAADARRFGFSLLECFEDDDFAILLLKREAHAAAHFQRQSELLRTLQRVRRNTYDLAEALTEAQLTEQHNPLMSPLVWDLSHIAAFEALWLQANLQGPAQQIDPDVDPDRHPRATRGALALPSSAEALLRLRRGRRKTTDDFGRADTGFAQQLVHNGYVYRMVAQHEAQHQETMLQAIQLMQDAPIEPAFVQPQPPRPDDHPTGMVRVPAGPFLLGTNDRTLAYDNERPAHTVDLGAYLIDATPVTNGAFLKFIEAGGYEDPTHWSPEGWAWRTQESATAPLYWESDESGWSRRLFSRLVGIDPQRPVIHVSFYEAEAYAAWAGKRLPTEAEWEKAAAWDGARREPRLYPWGNQPFEPQHANLGQRHLLTTPVGTYPQGRSFYGCHQLLGDCWEWTSSFFGPYPGFEAWPYPEYSEAFFGERYRVLRGASFATRSIVARNTFRNWDLPQRRQIFAGFRCVQAP